VDFEDLLAQNGRKGSKQNWLLSSSRFKHYVLPSFIFLFPSTISGGFLDVPAKLTTCCNSCRIRTPTQAAQC